MTLWGVSTGRPNRWIAHQSIRQCGKCVHVMVSHDDVIKWKYFLRYWPFVRGIHRWPVNSPHKGQWRGALMCSLIYARINGWVNNREAGALRRHRAHYDVSVMIQSHIKSLHHLTDAWTKWPTFGRRHQIILAQMFLKLVPLTIS